MNDTGPKVYAVKHKDESVRAAPRSGGVFTALSDAVLREKGVIYGCVLNEKFEAVHIRAESAEDRDHMRGSKYIQSRMGDMFRKAKEDLTAGKAVLFSGTSCQIAGLKKFLGKDYSNLLCVDIVCHGVPSPKVFTAYLEWQEKKRGRKVKSAEFRNKKDFGWAAHVETLSFEDGGSVNSRVFATLFYGHNILRPSCYECPYKSILHPGDITIADYWGIDNAAPGFNDNKGVSLVLINNPKGEAAFGNVKAALDWKSTRIENSMQPCLKAPFPRPQNRDAFWRDFASKSFDQITKKYGGCGLQSKLKSKLRAIKRALINR